MCKIINDSITSGVFPSRLNNAKVIPIYKNEDVTDPNNFRPISLLSVFNRIIEKLIYRQLKSFLEDRNRLYHSQYGFRERRSTEHALIDIVNQIQTNFDKGIYTCGIFIDLKKAFDTVDHSVLLQKLYYGVRGIVNDWFCSYLSNCIQSTQIGPDISNKQPMFCGVPQGSVLGPLLFLLYVNDIYRSSAKLAFYLFADDNNLLYADKNLRTLELVINSELHKVYEWLTANKLTLNIKKSNFIIFRTHQKKIDYHVNLRIFDNDSQTFLPLEQKSYVKYIGVLIDSNLSWKYHIGHITSKISETVGIIARLRYYVPTSVLLRIYQSSLIYPMALLCGAMLLKLTLIKFWSYKNVHFALYTLHLIGRTPFLFLFPLILSQ